MTDATLHSLLIGLADAIRDVPNGPEHQALVARFIRLLQHLESIELIESGTWQLGPRA